MPQVTEIGPDVYRLSVYVPEFELQFNHFLVKDEQPLLYHAGLKAMFPLLRDAVSQIIDPAQLRWIAFSHFESDECGGLNDWLELAPAAEPACSDLGAMVSVNDYATRPARALADGDRIDTGKYKFRSIRTPHLPHGWDASMLFEETQKTLFCSDMCHQAGDVEPLTSKDVVGRSIAVLTDYQAGPLADYAPYTHNTARLIQSLAELEPQRLAVMHGSSFEGDGARVLNDFSAALKQIFGGSGARPPQ